MTRTRLTLGLLVTTALAAPPALAQDTTPYQLDEIVISGALEARSADTTAQAVTVLTKDQIERAGETRLADLIAQTPGVGILARGPMGAQTGFTIRGVSQNYVKVLVDGIDVSDPSAPQVLPDLGRFNSFNYGRVEIMRGSQSAVYGGQAVAGVINLDTPRPTKEGLTQRLDFEAGSYNTANLAYGLGWKQGDDEVSVQLSKIYTAGYSAADENNGNTEDDGYRADRLSLRAQKRLSDNLLIGFAGFAQNDRGEFDNAFSSPPSDDGEYTVHKERGARAFAQFSTGRFDHEIGLTYYTTSRWYPVYAYGYEGKRRKIDWKAATDLGAGRLTFGADRTLETYKSRSAYGGSDVFTADSGVFAEYAVEPVQGVNIVASARHDDHSTFGGFTTGRLGVTWQADANTIYRASIGNGFRAPSGYELYGSGGSTSLKPEKSLSYDLGVERKLGAQTLTATLFRIEVQDLIDYSGSYYQTSGTAVRQGLELGLKGQLTGAVDYTLGYTYLDWKNPAGLSSGSTWNTSFGKHTFTAGLTAPLGEKFTAGADLRFVADRESLPDYSVVNAQLTYDLGNDKQAYFRVENLFDKQYELWPGYGTSDRAAYVGVRAQF